MLGSVKHGGSLGDIIYGLWALEKAGGCKVFLVSDKNMTVRLYEVVRPLLEAQPYIGKVRLIQEYHGYHAQGIDVDMDVFRGDLARKQPKHIIQAYVNMLNRIYGLNLPDFDGQPWLHNIPFFKPDKGFVAVNRSFRYRNPHFDYNRYIGQNPALFLGVKSEYEDFRKQYPPIDCKFASTPSLLNAASLIRASTYFVGNQSVGSALAQGLGHPQVQEFYPSMPDCMPSVRLEGQPFISNWRISETDYIVSGELMFPAFNIPNCGRRHGDKKSKPTRADVASIERGHGEAKRFYGHVPIKN